MASRIRALASVARGVAVPVAAYLCLLASLGAGTAAAAPPRPYLVPWIAVSPGDPLPPSPPPDVAGGSINAPGLLVEAWGGSLAAAETPGAIAQAFAEARLAGRKTGLSFEVPELPVPADAREAEAASAGSLLPGLDAALAAARGADLFVLSLPDLPDDVRARRYLLMKVAAEVRARAPAARVAVLFHQPHPGDLFPKAARDLLSDEAAAYVDIVGIDLDDARTPPGEVRAAADELAFARPLLVRTPRLPDAAALLSCAARFSTVDAPFVAAPLASAADAPVLDRLGAILVGDFARDARAAEARTATGETLESTRLAPASDLGGVVLIPGFTTSGALARGPLVLSLEAPDYVSADVVELATGRSRRFAIPKTAAPPRLALSTANGPIAVVLAPREKPKEEAAHAAAAVTAVRGITAEEILAKHQVWRAARDARWTRFVGTNRTSIRFRFEGLDNSFELSFEGPLFYEKGKGFDWAWSTAYVNGVRWRGKKFPTLPLLQPEKVSELPLTLTFNDAYRYELDGETTVAGLPCWKLKFQPKASASAEPLYAGTVYIAQGDFSVRRVDTRQLNLTGEVQSADETTDFGEVPAPDGKPLLLPVRTRGQWIVKTFSRTTTLERYTELTGVSIDPPDFEARKKAVSASDSVMVRDTDKGIRYLEKNKQGERVVVEDTKTAKLFGLGGVFYDGSYDYPLPLLGVYYIDLDVGEEEEAAAGLLRGGRPRGLVQRPEPLRDEVRPGRRRLRQRHPRQRQPVRGRDRGQGPEREEPEASPRTSTSGTRSPAT